MKFNFEHGANIYEYANYNEIIDFSSNTNPLGLPENLNITLDIFQEKYTRYPDPKNTALISKLAQYEQTKEEYFYIGNGASDIIFRLVYSLKPKKVLLLAPTFSEYEKACQSINAKISYYNLEETNNFLVLSDILSNIISDIDLVIICNPNNPTGSLIDNELLKKIIDKCYENSTHIMIDECFIDFVENNEVYTTKKYLTEYNNLIILKAFTKTFAMAGFRLGYCMLNNLTLKNKLFQHGADWPISTIAQEIGIKALFNETYLNDTLKLLKEERNYLSQQLTILNCTVYQGESNYIFFRYDGEINLKKKLIKKNILIRSCENYRGLDNKYYRICIKKHNDNVQLIKCISAIIKDNN